MEGAFQRRSNQFPRNLDNIMATMLETHIAVASQELAVGVRAVIVENFLAGFDLSK